MSKKLDNDKIKQFVLGGNAIFTLRSGKTGNHFTYHIVKSDMGNSDHLYKVHQLCGPDNTKDYRFIGLYWSDTDTFYNAHYKDLPFNSMPQSMRAIVHFLQHLDNIHPALEVYHEGRCASCGRRLTTPESIERGFGPECYKRRNK